MSAFLDSSVLVAALAPDETKHSDCLALLLQGGHCIYYDQDTCPPPLKEPEKF